MKVKRVGIRIIHCRKRFANPINIDREYAYSRSEVYNKCNGRCYYCGLGLSFRTMTVDHYIPRSAGGSDRLTNLVPACYACNNSKDDLHPEDWRERFFLRTGKREFYAERKKEGLSW